MKRALIDAAVVVAAFVTAAMVPAIIDGPGQFAQSCFDEKCRNLGPGDPYAGGVYYHNDPAQAAEPYAHCNHGRLESDV